MGRRAAVALVAMAGAAAADPIQVSLPAADALPAALVTPIARWHRQSELPWLVLELPETAIGLVFAPIGLVVRAVEGTRADRVVRAPHQIGSSRVKLAPRLQYQRVDGVGIGLGVAFGQGRLPFATGAGGMVRLDGDWTVEVTGARGFDGLESRFAHVRVAVDHDDHQRFYGIGGGSVVGDRRALAVHAQEVTAEAELQPGTWQDYSGAVQIGLARQDLGAGDPDAAAPVAATDPGDPDAAAPPGFADATTYGTLRAVGRIDSRDTLGRPTDGVLVEVLAALRADVQGKDLAAATLRADVVKYLALGEENRVLVMAIGGEIAVPLYPGATIPLLALPTLGRDARLRGYDRGRFRDRYAAWASVEYRWPLYQYNQSGVWVDAFVFADGAEVFGVDAIAAKRLRYSGGGGFRLAHSTASIADVTIGGSPEGAQVMFGTTLALGGPERD